MTFDNQREQALRALAQAIAAAPSPSAVDELWNDVETLFNGPVLQAVNPPTEGGGNGEPPGTGGGGG